MYSPVHFNIKFHVWMSLQGNILLYFIQRGLCRIQFMEYVPKGVDIPLFQATRQAPVFSSHP